MQVEIIIHYLKPNNLYLSFPSNIQIISQEQLNVDIFSSQESWSGAAPRMRTSSQCLSCKYLQYLQYWQIFGHPNTMLDWRANSNIILHTNIRVCPNTVYSNAGFKCYVIMWCGKICTYLMRTQANIYVMQGHCSMNDRYTNHIVAVTHNIDFRIGAFKYYVSMFSCIF